MKELEILKNDISKPEIEQVEKEKQEYKLLGKFLRTPGLRLYGYNSLKDELFEVETSKKAIVNFMNTETTQPEEATVDSRNIHFEALNQKNAEKRLKKYKAGKITELCNLREPNPEGIKIF